MTNVLLSVLLAIILTACTNAGNSKREYTATTGTNTTISSACNIVHYYNVISVLNEDQKAQAAKALQSSANDSGKLRDCNQIKLAILLSAPDSNLQDDKTSIDLLTDFVHNAQSVKQADKTFAMFLKQFVEERSQIRYQHTKTRNLLKIQQQEAETIKEELAITRKQLQQLKSLESELSHQEKRITPLPLN